jgi:hypothetical protein
LHLRRERPGHTLQSTALAHKAYQRMIDQQSVPWQNRSHFYGIAAQMIRRILVDYARVRLIGSKKILRMTLSQTAPLIYLWDMEVAGVRNGYRHGRSDGVGFLIKVIRRLSHDLI